MRHLRAHDLRRQHEPAVFLKRNVKLLLGRHTQSNVVADMPPQMIRHIFETIGPGAMVLELNGIGESPMTRSWQLVLEASSCRAAIPF
jgi:hypothetical protein